MIPGYPGISIVAKSPAFVAHGSFFFPLSDSSRPEKTGDFILEGEIEYSIPQQKIFILFSHFRVDTSGNVFASFKLNGQEIGGGEIELLNAASDTSPATDKNKLTISAKELISTDFADAIKQAVQCDRAHAGSGAGDIKLGGSRSEIGGSKWG
jgi:hypothetical protein